MMLRKHVNFAAMNFAICIFFFLLRALDNVLFHFSWSSMSRNRRQIKGSDSKHCKKIFIRGEKKRNERRHGGGGKNINDLCKSR